MTQNTFWSDTHGVKREGFRIKELRILHPNGSNRKKISYLMQCTVSFHYSVCLHLKLYFTLSSMSAPKLVSSKPEFTFDIISIRQTYYHLTISVSIYNL